MTLRYVKHKQHNRARAPRVIDSCERRMHVPYAAPQRRSGMNPRRRLAVSGVVIAATAVTALASGPSHWPLATVAAASGLVAIGVFLAAWRRVFPGTGRQR